MKLITVSDAISSQRCCLSIVRAGGGICIPNKDFLGKFDWIGAKFEQN